jgi:hypothetical protein
MAIVLESSATPTNSISQLTTEHDKSRDLTSATSSLSLRHGGEMETAMITMPPPKIGYIDWMSTRIRNDPETPLPDPELRVDPTARRYLDSFFEHFHHRWGLIRKFIPLAISISGSRSVMICPQPRCPVVTQAN